jgi:hypothetical protein
MLVNCTCCIVLCVRGLLRWHETPVHRVSRSAIGARPCRAALCVSASAVSLLTAAAASCCRFASDFSEPLHRRTQQLRMLPNPGLPAHGSVRIAVAPWFSWRSSLLNRSSEDLLSRSVSLTRHSSHSSPKHSFAPAREIDVCLNAFGNTKTDRNSSSPKRSVIFPSPSPPSRHTLEPFATARFVMPDASTSIQHP